MAKQLPSMHNTLSSVTGVTDTRCDAQYLKGESRVKFLVNKFKAMLDYVRPNSKRKKKKRLNKTHRFAKYLYKAYKTETKLLLFK